MRPSYLIGTVVFEPHPNFNELWTGFIDKQTSHLTLPAILALGGVEIEEAPVRLKLFWNPGNRSWVVHHVPDSLSKDHFHTITGTARRI